MARLNRDASLDELVQSAVAPVVARLSKAIARQIAALTARELAAALSRSPRRAGRAATPARSRRRHAEMTSWVADKRARRVPKFVIDATGLDTKKKIVARYGDGAAFEKGKPLPKVVENGGEAARPREVKAKGPTIRKKAAAA